MVPLSFIQARIAEIEHYINNIDAGVSRRIDNNNPVTEDKFAQIFNSKINTTENQEINKANLTKLPEDFAEYIQTTINEISESYGVELPHNLVMSLIKQESGFNPSARSSAGAEGLMQLMPATAKSMGVFNTMNPYQNLRGGVKYLAEQIKAFDGNIPKALAAYNAGPEAVKRYNGIPPYKETQNYVESIMANYLRQENYSPVDVIA